MKRGHMIDTCEIRLGFNKFLDPTVCNSAYTCTMNALLPRL